MIATIGTVYLAELIIDNTYVFLVFMVSFLDMKDCRSLALPWKKILSHHIWRYVWFTWIVHEKKFHINFFQYFYDYYVSLDAIKIKFLHGIFQMCKIENCSLIYILLGSIIILIKVMWEQLWTEKLPFQQVSYPLKNAKICLKKSILKIMHFIEDKNLDSLIAIKYAHENVIATWTFHVFLCKIFCDISIFATKTNLACQFQIMCTLESAH